MIEEQTGNLIDVLRRNCERGKRSMEELVTKRDCCSTCEWGDKVVEALETFIHMLDEINRYDREISETLTKEAEELILQLTVPL